MPLVSLDRIITGPNVRAGAQDDDEEGFRRSIATQGVLQAILLRPLPNPDMIDGADAPDRLQVVLGFRRYRAALALGLIEIPAEIRPMSDVEVAQAQLAENIQRRDMHPVDQWRGVHGLIQEHGLSFEQAAAGLGLDHRVIRRLEMLGRLDPTFLALARIQMPLEKQLRVIAAAPLKLQAQVARDKGLVVMTGARETVDWHRVTDRCSQRRIPRTAAIFDWTAVKGLVWDEDLFAEPGSDEQFTTADADGFVKHQTTALRAKVAERVKAKKRHQVATMKDTWRVALPHGFAEVSGGDVEKPHRHETVFHAVAPDGGIVVTIGLDKKAASEAAARKKAPGTAPATTPAKATAMAEPGDDVEGEGDDDGTMPPAEEAAKPPFTRKGLALLASAKNDAILTALESPTSSQKLLGLLVLALACENVTIFTERKRVRFDDLAARMLAPGGNFLDLSVADIAQIAGAAIGRIINMVGPDAIAQINPDSGPAAEWIGAAINAETGLPRFDTEAFLATASVAELKRAATGAGLLASGTAIALRERLKGRAPNYRPEAAVFGAPAPKVRTDA